MATLITKNSSTASSVPTAAQLVQGELAVNVTDKRLFTENSSGTVVELGTNPSTLALPNGTANGVAYLNGSKVLTTGSALTFDGTNLALTTTGAIYRVPAAGGSLFDAGGNNGIYILGSSNYIATYVAGSEQMRLTSTGLGIGTSSPFSKLDVKFATDKHAIFTASASYSNSADLIAVNDAGSEVALGLGGSTVRFYTGATERMRLDSSGNLGLGVTPSAWESSYRVLSMGIGGSVFGRTSGSEVYLSGNLYRNTAGTWKYRNAGGGTLYIAGGDSTYVWYNVPTGGAADGNATLNAAMTLDASGNLGLGATSPLGAFEIIRNSSSGSGVAYPNIRLDNQSATGYTGFYFLNSGTSKAFLEVKNDVGALTMGTGSTERARITSGGYFKASNAGTYQDSTGAYHEIRNNGAGSNAVWLTHTSASDPYGPYINFSAAAPNNATNYFINCVDTGGNRATIRSNGGLANYQANDVNLSDRREKTNFAPAKSYLDTICAIPVQTFNYIDQSEDDPGLTLGVVAQDVQAVAPELVMESNWGTKEDPKMRLSIYQTDLQYALMKALQELKAEFDAYKATHP